MASFLSGLTLLESTGFIGVVVPLILVSLIVYAVLAKTQVLGENVAVNVVIAFLVGLVFASVLPATKFLSDILPFATGLLVIIFLVFMLLKFTGAESMTKTVSIIGFSVFLIGILIIFITSFETINPVREYQYSEGEMTAEEEVAFEQDLNRGFLYDTILNPAVIALILLILIAGLTAYFVAK